MQDSYTRALRVWQPLAEQGNPIAQFNLGTLYRDGLGVPQDGVEAMKWAIGLTSSAEVRPSRPGFTSNEIF